MQVPPALACECARCSGYSQRCHLACAEWPAVLGGGGSRRGRLPVGEWALAVSLLGVEKRLLPAFLRAGPGPASALSQDLASPSPIFSGLACMGRTHRRPSPRSAPDCGEACRCPVALQEPDV